LVTVLTQPKATFPPLPERSEPGGRRARQTPRRRFAR
jgi:hypothetical protein